MKDARERAEKVFEDIRDYYDMYDANPWGEGLEIIATALNDAYRAGMLRAAEVATDNGCMKTAYDIRAEAGKGERG